MIVIEFSVASVTVNEATPTCPANAAITVTVPGATPAAWPNDPGASLMIATVGFDDVHSTELVISCVVPSASVAVAVKAIAVPSATLKPALLPVEIVIAVNPSTVRLAVLLVTPPSSQVIAAEPLISPVAMFSSSDTMVGSEDDQVATVSTGCVVPSLNAATASNSRFEFTVRLAVAGVTVIFDSVAELTFSGTDPVAVAPPNVNVAEIVAVAPPGNSAVATPMLPHVLLMVATPGLLLAHTTSCVMFCVLASLKVPMAVKGCTVSGAIVTLEGPTTIDWMVAVVTTSVAIPLTEPRVAVMVVIPFPTACARPGPVAIVATTVFDEAHVN